MIVESFLVKFDGSGSKIYEILWFLAMCWVPEAVGAQQKQIKLKKLYTSTGFTKLNYTLGFIPSAADGMGYTPFRGPPAARPPARRPPARRPSRPPARRPSRPPARPKKPNNNPYQRPRANPTVQFNLVNPVRQYKLPDREDLPAPPDPTPPALGVISGTWHQTDPTLLGLLN